MRCGTCSAIPPELPTSLRLAAPRPPATRGTTHDLSSEADAREPLAAALRALRQDSDDTVYEILSVDSIEEALTAAALNGDIQVAVVRHDLPLRSARRTPLTSSLVDIVDTSDTTHHYDWEEAGEALREMRPHIDLYALHGESIAAGGYGTPRAYNRTFYRLNDPTDLHSTIVAGLRRRYRAPFFDALREYADAPVGQFHALPVARGASVFNSKTLGDMADTSPNQELTASLDLARRQVDLEGFEMVWTAYRMALAFRHRVATDPDISTWFRILDERDLVPDTYRCDDGMSYEQSEDGDLTGWDQAWRDNEFVLDPTRVTLYLGRTGMNGFEFRQDVLMNRYGIQINKTSRGCPAARRTAEHHERAASGLSTRPATRS